MANSVDPSTNSRAVMRQFRLAFFTLFLFGFLGLVAAVPALRDLIGSSGSASMSTPAMVAIAVLQPALLLAMWVVIGIFLAPRLHLRSHIVARVWKVPFEAGMLRRDLLTGSIAGIAVAVVVLLLAAVIDPLLGTSAAALSHVQPRTIGVMVEGVLYGGLTEELIMRWGVMSLLAWLAWRFLQRDGAPIRGAAMWPAIVLSAILFGIVHLGAVASPSKLEAVLITREVLLNALSGLVFGWLFWRRSLESAMLSHVVFHLVVTLAAWLGFQHAAMI